MSAGRQITGELHGDPTPFRDLASPDGGAETGLLAHACGDLALDVSWKSFHPLEQRARSSPRTASSTAVPRAVSGCSYRADL